MLTTIISQIPLWVAPLFFGLIFLGLRATKTRKVPLAIIYTLPLLALISLQSLAQLPNQTLVWSLYVLFYVSGGVLGFRLQAQWVIAKHQRHIEVSGEWTTLITMMIIFWLSFATGVTRAIAPSLMASTTVQAALCIIVSMAGGIFAGRALRILYSAPTAR